MLVSDRAMNPLDPQQAILGPSGALGPGEGRGQAGESQRPKPGRDRGDKAMGIRQFVVDAAQLLDGRHCEDVVIFDLRGLSDVTDYILIASGSSDRQITSVASELRDFADERSVDRFGSEQDASTTWLVIDFVDVVVHIFDPSTRAHYDLEMMWNDAPRIIWQQADGN